VSIAGIFGLFGLSSGITATLNTSLIDTTKDVAVDIVINILTGSSKNSLSISL
jgi:hypothetical protein